MNDCIRFNSGRIPNLHYLCGQELEQRRLSFDQARKLVADRIRKRFLLFQISFYKLGKLYSELSFVLLSGILIRVSEVLSNLIHFLV